MMGGGWNWGQVAHMKTVKCGVFLNKICTNLVCLALNYIPIFFNHVEVRTTLPSSYIPKRKKAYVWYTNTVYEIQLTYLGAD